MSEDYNGYGKDVFSHKLVLLGDMGVGKSSIVDRYVSGKFSSNHTTTIGACFNTRTVELNEYFVKFEIWDTAGQERYHALAQMYYKSAIAAIVVFDVTNNETFERAKQWVEELFDKADANIVVAMAGNKVDMNDYQVNKDEINQYCDNKGLFYHDVSAKENINIEELFYDIAKKLPKNDAKNAGHGVGLQEGGNTPDKAGGCSC